MQYEIKGDNLPVLLCELEEGEAMITESGAMSWMSMAIKMETQGTGGVGKSIGRMFAGESVFQNKYTADNGPGQIAFASSFPGSIAAIDVEQNPIIAQKKVFLCGQDTVDLSIAFQKKIGTGLFGGEGFIMQRLGGSGLAFLEIDGSAIEYELKAGESMKLDTGYLAYMSATCTMDIQRIKGAKNIFLGGEGLFNTVVTGPGKVVVQTMPINQVADALRPFLVTTN